MKPKETEQGKEKVAHEVDIAIAPSPDSSGTQSLSLLFIQFILLSLHVWYREGWLWVGAKTLGPPLSAKAPFF